MSSIVRRSGKKTASTGEIKRPAAEEAIAEDIQTSDRDQSETLKDHSPNGKPKQKADASKNNKTKSSKDRQRKTVDILKESRLLVEIKDTLDELNIIRTILDEQREVSSGLFNLVSGTGTMLKPTKGISRNLFLTTMV